MIGSNDRLRDEKKEQQLVLKRLKFCAAIVVVFSLLLAARYTQLQVWEHQTYATRSDNNRIRLQALPPTRGLIYDRNGEILADNRPAYRLELVPEKVKDMDATLARLSELVRLDEDDLKRFKQRRRGSRRFNSIPLRFAMSDQEVAQVAVNRHLLPGVEVVPYLTRFYPYGSLLSHVTGYVGRLDSDDVPEGEEDNYRGTTHAGQSGLERFYESVLHGQAGWQRVETNVEGRILNTLARQNPERGQDLVLSIDLDIQRTAAKALRGAPGAVVAMDVNNGDILALVSEPSYDPNLFVNGISSSDYRRLLNSPGKPLFNRTLRGRYEPGSTLKPFVALAALDEGAVGMDARYFSSGKFFLPNSQRPYRDWLKGGHGWVDIRQALEQSVNTAFYQMALDLGIDRLHSKLRPFGFGQLTGIDLPGEKSGLLPSREWKRAQLNQAWYPGETVITGIGQGYTLTTPVQLAAATTALAGGTWHRPHLMNFIKPAANANPPEAALDQAENTDPSQQSPPQNAIDTLDQIVQQAGHSTEARVPSAESSTPMSLIEAGTSHPVMIGSDPLHWELVHSGMEMVVHGIRGTARAIAPSDYHMAGKTGTAQVYTQAEDQEYVEEEVAQHLRHNALFIAFAPVEDPQIAVAIVVEHGGSGSRSAAPVARAVIDAWHANNERSSAISQVTNTRHEQ
ncbi:MAG: penicillin-binding protein 2 [Xanthomonadales bacterium]|nr:penicillin-binding protein 2 [Xanthomonadales bacterium]